MPTNLQVLSQCFLLSRLGSLRVYRCPTSDTSPQEHSNPHGREKHTIEKSQAGKEDNGPQIKAGSLVEAEVDLEIRGLQAGGGRRGSDASQSNGCCMDPAYLHNFLTSEADLTSSLCLSKTTPERRIKGNQPPGGGGGEYDVERRRSPSRENGPPVPGGREGFSDGSVF